MKTRIRLIAALVTLLALASVNFPSVSAASLAGVPYSGLAGLGMPSAPQTFYPATGYDVAVTHSQAASLGYDYNGALQAADTHADHGPACDSPATDTALLSTGTQHTVTTLADSVYVCHDHVMTALDDTGYAQASITPDAVADWSGGQTVAIQWRVSTYTASDRDWWDVSLVPFSQQFDFYGDPQGDQLSGLTRTGLFVQSCGAGASGQHSVCLTVMNNGASRTVANTGAAIESVLTPSRINRTLYEMDVSSGHVKIFLPADSTLPGRTTALTLLDANVTIPFTQGALTIAQEAYDELKSDACGPPSQQRANGGGCAPNTWHWSNISISNSLHFDIAHPSARIMRAGSPVNPFPAPAQAGSFLKFNGFWGSLQASFDGGASYHAVSDQASVKGMNSYGLRQAFIPVPAGATGVLLKGTSDGYGGSWVVHDIALFGPVGSATPPPTPTPNPSPQPSPTGTPTPIQMNNTPCMITLNGQMVNGTCTGTFVPQ